jgi:hypothetical protein
MKFSVLVLDYDRTIAGNGALAVRARHELVERVPPSRV